MSIPLPTRLSLFLLGVSLTFALFPAPPLLRAQTSAATAPASDDAAAPAPAAPAASSAPRSSTGEFASSTYRLQPYDLIDVDVYGEGDLHKPARLGADGTILLPLIGSIKVGGLTVSEAADFVSKRYAAGYLKNPSVLISVLQYQKGTYAILGQVQKSGVYDIPEGVHVSIVDAISQAGGFTPTADQNAVTVKRTVENKQALYKINAGDMAQNPGVLPFEILPGDTILVNARQYQKSTFAILGQVQKSGVYDIPPGAHITIVDAISLSGGFTPTADQNSVTVKRTTDGKPALYKIKAGDMAQNPDTDPFEILPGDTILVGIQQSGDSKFAILGQVQRPGLYDIPPGSHVTIIDAILLAGGYTRAASQNSVTVKRTIDGKTSLYKVRAGDMAQNPNLVPFEVLPGDIIKVNESWF